MTLKDWFMHSDHACMKYKSALQDTLVLGVVQIMDAKSIPCSVYLIMQWKSTYRKRANMSNMKK